VQYRADDLTNASADVSKSTGQATALVLALARCRQLHFINFLTAATRDRRRRPRNLQADARMRHVTAQVCQEFWGPDGSVTIASWRVSANAAVVNSARNPHSVAMAQGVCRRFSW
jgi:hypothetical protein